MWFPVRCVRNLDKMSAQPSCDVIPLPTDSLDGLVTSGPRWIGRGLVIGIAIAAVTCSEGVAVKVNVE